MRARQWIWVAFAGLLAFSTAALGTGYIISSRLVHGVTATRIGGPFTLVDDTGAPVTDKTLAGKPDAMYFGYTFCPDVCPTTLLDLSRWIKKLGPEADRLNYVFVTVDPERDTVQSLHAHLSSFDERIRGCTGTPAEIPLIAREYRVYYKKVPTDDGGYTMDHSAIIYLMGSDDKLVTVIPYQEADASAIAKLKNLAVPTPTSSARKCYNADAGCRSPMSVFLRKRRGSRIQAARPMGESAIPYSVCGRFPISWAWARPWP